MTPLALALLLCASPPVALGVRGGAALPDEMAGFSTSPWLGASMAVTPGPVLRLGVDYQHLWLRPSPRIEGLSMSGDRLVAEIGGELTWWRLTGGLAFQMGAEWRRASYGTFSSSLNEACLGGVARLLFALSGPWHLGMEMAAGVRLDTETDAEWLPALVLEWRQDRF